jgi:hypothetical protein
MRKGAERTALIVFEGICTRTISIVSINTPVIPHLDLMLVALFGS